MNKIYDLLISVILTITTMFIFLILYDCASWRGGVLGVIHIIAMALYFGGIRNE